MLTNSQKKRLKQRAMSLDSTFQIGKSGITEQMILGIDQALDRRELVKITVLKNADIMQDDAADDLSQALQCEVVQVIGRKIILFRVASEEKYQKISKEIHA